MRLSGSSPSIISFGIFSPLFFFCDLMQVACEPTEHLIQKGERDKKKRFFTKIIVKQTE
jgi:hypothetical protein